MKEGLTIRAYRPSDAIPQITDLLHVAYAPLAKMGFRYTATHQDDAMTLRRLWSGEAYIAEWGGQMVGTVVLRRPMARSECAWYRQKSVYSFGQFAVHPEQQRKGIGLALMQFIEQRARVLGASELALDTAEGATHLVQWYERLGYRFIEHVSWKDTNYRSVVLSKTLVENG